MPQETPHFGFEVPSGTDPVDIPLHLLELAEQIEELLEGFPVEELGTAGAGDAGKLLVVKNTGAAAWAAMSGDATLNHEGKLAIANLAVTEAKLAALAVTAAKIAAEAIETGKIKNLAVTAAKIAAEAVETAKIANLAITEAKLAAEAVGTGKIANLAVTEAKLAALAVTAAKIAEGAVTETKIGDGAVTSRKMKPTTGLVAASADLALTEAYQDITGTTLEITPAVASILLVTTVFDIEIHPNAEKAATGIGTLSVDAVDQERVAQKQALIVPTGNAVLRDTVFQQYRLALTAAKHTIKMRCKKTGAEPMKVYKTNTCFMYQLVAS